MTSKVSLDALMSKWQEIHGDLDVFQKDLFVEHVSIPSLQDFEMIEIEKALHITPKLSEALVLLQEYEDLDEYSPDLNFSTADVSDFEDLKSDVTYEVVAPIEPAEDDILGLELGHDQQAETVHLWI
jgi:hypothetical protein